MSVFICVPFISTLVNYEFVETGSMLMPQVKILSRHEWGALPPVSVDKMETPIPFISITYANPKDGVEDEKEIVREIQRQNMEMGMTDIQSNFLVGKDGRVYEGRGWTSKPGLGEFSTVRQRKNNGKYLEITFINNYKRKPESNPLLKATSQILREGIRRNFIPNDFTFLEEFVNKYDGSQANTVSISPRFERPKI